MLATNIAGIAWTAFTIFGINYDKKETNVSSE
jgi:hypothetical protein